MVASAPRDRLLDAAIDHLAEHGLGDTSLRAIAGAIGTSHRMLSYHFGGRTELLTAVSREVERRQRAWFAQMLERDVEPVALMRDMHARFADPALPGRSFLCPDCTLIEGILALCPELTGRVAIHRIGFARPRAAVVARIGEAHQSLPVLILAEGRTSPFRSGAAGGREFISDPKGIAAEWSRHFAIPELHP